MDRTMAMTSLQEQLEHAAKSIIDAHVSAYMKNYFERTVIPAIQDELKARLFITMKDLLDENGISLNVRFDK